MSHQAQEDPGGGTDRCRGSGDRCYENLILLCNTHHELVDASEATYISERLRAMKEDHERWVEHRLAQEHDADANVPAMHNDELYSTLLPVARIPQQVFQRGGQRFKTEEETRAQLGDLRRNEAAPFVLRENRVMAFKTCEYGATHSSQSSLAESSATAFRTG